MLTESEKRELLEAAASDDLRRDMRTLARRAATAAPDLDAYITFATVIARLGNHATRPPRRIRDGHMRI